MLYHVDSEEVAAAAARSTRSGETIRAEVAALVGSLQALEGTWQGTASTAFAGVLAQWRSAQAQVEAALGSLTQALGAAAAGYAEAESTAARMFSR
jgi:early secretory antigenic target protein ESAT-6